MTHYLYTFIIFLPYFSSLLAMTSSKSINLEDHCTKACFESGDESRFVAVSDVPYFICCESNPSLKLRSTDKGFDLSSDEDSSCVFLISKNSANSYLCSITNVSGVLVASVKEKTIKNRCRLYLATQQGKKISVSISFSETEDGLADYLLHNSENASSYFGGLEKRKADNSRWLLVPTYDFAKNLSLVDRQSQLLHLPKTEPTVDKKVSPANLASLYKLHIDAEELKIIAGSDFHYALLSSMLFERGIELFSGDSCELEVTNLAGCDITDLKTKKRLTDDKKNTVVKVGSGKAILVKPTAFGSTVQFGDLIITFKKRQLVGSSSGSTKKLRDIITTDSPLYTDFALLVNPDAPESITFERTDKSPHVNSGGASFALELASKAIIRVAGGELFRSVNRASDAIENFGQRVENSSRNIKQALIVSSKQLGDSFEAVAATFSSSLDHATRTFESTARFVTTKLCTTAAMISDDVKESTKVLSASIRDSSQCLSTALEESSKNIKSASTEIKDGMKAAGQSFENAFKDLSTALESTGDKAADALKTASTKFVEGMEKLESAAKHLSKAQFVKVCLLL